ncbi:M23 family metallopeptidase [Rubritalea tangerina]|uniref:M23 family metallopeptidase n=1 Tax=Rubritalea tangerina TaxID=430798 RepID=A0ABW4ZB41_9BACT
MPLVLSRLVPALLFGLFFYVGYLVMTTRHVPELPVQSLDTWQKADAPYGIPLKLDQPELVQQFDPRMHLHSPFEAALIPTAPRFDPPMGSEHAALTYNAQSFMAPNATRGGQHTGDDINGIGGQNSDLGDPVFAIANGLVVYAGTPSPGWGKTIILAHRLNDGRILHSMYAHLHEIHVATKSHIARSQEIGTVGNAGGRYLAHLHLEMRHTDGFSPQTGYASHPFDRLPPEQTIDSLRNAPDDALNPSTLQILQQDLHKKLPIPEMDAESALKFQEFLERSSPNK